MRPTGRACARCVRAMTPCPGHLENAWDHYALKTRGTTELDGLALDALNQELVEYALNRMLALDRDNGNKAQGLQASRIYKSRNTRVSEALATKCHVRRGAVQCMRNAGHPTDDRDDHGSHKF